MTETDPNHYYSGGGCKTNLAPRPVPDSKVFLIAGHHNGDPGAVNTALNFKESELTKDLRDLTAHELRKMHIIPWLDNDAHSLNTVVAQLAQQSKESDIIIDIHFNAASPEATGVEVIIPNRSTEKERDFAAKACSLLSSIMKIRNRGVKTEADTRHKKLAIMSPVGTNILIEVCFISNWKDMNAYQANRKEIAEELAQLISEFVNS